MDSTPDRTRLRLHQSASHMQRRTYRHDVGVRIISRQPPVTVQRVFRWKPMTACFSRSFSQKSRCSFTTVAFPPYTLIQPVFALRAKILVVECFSIYTEPEHRQTSASARHFSQRDRWIRHRRFHKNANSCPRDSLASSEVFEGPVSMPSLKEVLCWQDEMPFVV